MNVPDAETLYHAVLDEIRAAYPADAFGAPGGVAIVGIHSGGAWIAERLAQDVGALDWGVLNVALHRDDYAKKGLHSKASPTALPFAVEGRHILLVDDVLYTARTVRPVYSTSSTSRMWRPSTANGSAVGLALLCKPFFA